MNSLKNIIDKNKLKIIYLSMFSFLEPDLFNEYAILHNSMMLIRVILTVLLCVDLAMNIKKEMDPFLISFLAFFGILFTITILKRGDLIYSISTSIPIIGLILMVRKIHRSGFDTLGILSNVFTVLVVANLVHIVFFQPYYSDSNVNRVYLLGNRNQLAPTLFPAVAISYADSMIKNTKLNKRTIYVSLIVLVSIILTKSATSLVGVVLLMFYFILFHKRERIKYINFSSIIIALAIVFLLFVIWRKQDIFSIFIEDILGKDLTFSTRTKIWDKAIATIKDNILYVCSVKLFIHSFI